MLRLIIIATLLLANCALPPTSIYKTSSADAEFYGSSNTAYRCTLMEANPFLGATRSISLLAIIPDDTTQIGQMSIQFYYSHDSWEFITGIEMKIGDSLYNIHFDNPLRDVITGSNVVEQGITPIHAKLVSQMLNDKVSFRFSGKVYSANRENIVEWWNNIPRYWQNRIKRAG